MNKNEAIIIPLEETEDILDFSQSLYKQLKDNKVKLGYRVEDCGLAEFMISEHMWDFHKFYFSFFENFHKVLKKRKKKELSFGDADFYIKLIHDTKEKSVYIVRDTCTCADINNWIVIHDHDECIKELHVRELHERGDYPRSQYPEKLNLKFWKDRDFVCEYVQKHHMTKLGRVYGDIRDTGYVISYTDVWTDESLENFAKIGRTEEQMNRNPELFNYFHFYNEWKNFTFRLKSIQCQLDEEEGRDEV